MTKNNYSELIKELKHNKKLKKDVKHVTKQFQQLEDHKKDRKYLDINDIKNLDLKQIHDDFNGFYIKNTNICININKRPIKNNKNKYSAISYDFIKLLEDLKIDVEMEI